MAETILKNCRVHGENSIFVNRGKTYRCRACSVDAVAKRRKDIKLMAIAYKGGKCCKCGYFNCVSALEFHHADPSEKDFNISHKGHCRSWERVKKELDKCILVCSNCHKEIHVELLKD